MTALHFSSATSIARRIREGEIGAREALEHFIARIERYNGEVNAVVCTDYEGARARADEADRSRARGDELAPLHGVPLTIKEMFDVSGLPTTWGATMLKDNVATRDALVVKRLTAAGANIFGKTNVPEWGADNQSVNDVYGRSCNPYDLTRSVGGSSGGSAASLAAGFTSFEIGSDIGGSIRNPSHFCGTFGLKTTFGIVPTKGHELPGQLAAMDVCVTGPMARSADDLDLLMGLIAKPDEEEVQGIYYDFPRLAKPLSEMRVATWRSEDAFPVAREVQDRVTMVAEMLAEHGARVTHDRKPDIDFEVSRQTHHMICMASLALMGPDEPVDPDPQNTLDVNGWGADAAKRLRYRDWAHWHENRLRLHQSWREFFKSYDVLIAPSSSTPAFPHESRPIIERTLDIDGKAYPYMDQAFWPHFVSIGHLPSVVVPTGLNEQGLPIGVQLIGNYYSDMKLVGLAQRLERMGLRFVPPAGY